MFASRYFVDRYFAPRYFVKVGEDPAPVVLVPATGDSLTLIPQRKRISAVPSHNRTTIIPRSQR